MAFTLPTVGIVFHFETTDHDVYSGRQIDVDAWRYTCKAFGIQKMCMVDLVPGGSRVNMMDEEMIFQTYTDLSDFEAAHADDALIYLETEWTFPEDVTYHRLPTYGHALPEDKNVWYIFGPGHGFSPTSDDGRTWVTMPQEGTGALHSVHIAPVILAHLWYRNVWLPANMLPTPTPTPTVTPTNKTIT